MTHGAGTTGGPRHEASTGAGVTASSDPVVIPPPGADVHRSPAEAANPVVDAELGTSEHPHAAEQEKPRRGFSLGMDRFSGLYVWAALIIIFGIWVPDTFLRVNTLTIILGDQAITAMLALGIIIPLAAGVFDLSFAGVCGVAVAVTAWAQVEGYNPAVAALLAILVATAIGAVNGFVVVQLKVNSFIATLGMSSLLLALTYWITDGVQIVSGFRDWFLDLGTLQIIGIPLPFYAMVVLAVVVYIVIEYLPIGRYLYASGGNPVAA